MNKVLYVNGCSHTAGTELSMEGRLDLTWPNLLAEHLEFDLVNDSDLGASNDRIFRTTVEYILSAAIPPEKVVVQFSDHERFEINQMGMNPRSPNLDKKFLPFVNEYFEMDRERANTSPGYTHKLLNQIYSLQLILENMGIDDYTFMVWRKVDESYITYRHINRDKIFFNMLLKLSQKYEVCQTPDPDRGNIPDRHFGQDAHYEVFEWLKYGKSRLDKAGKAEHIIENAY